MLGAIKKLFGGGGGRARGVRVGAFGKHPGWNDHIDDQGLETESMVEFKGDLYVRGIAPNIDGGDWAEGKADRPFGHVFVRTGGGDGVIVGRMWASEDGRGRSAYPMVVCAECGGLGLDWAVREALPRLASLEEACRGTGEAASVVRAVGATRGELLSRAARTHGDGRNSDDGTSALRELARAIGREGMERVLYALEGEWGELVSGDGEGVGKGLRVPRAADSPERAAWLWTVGVRTRLDGRVPLTVFASIAEPVVDMVGGELTPEAMVWLRRSASLHPPASEVPYTIDASFAARVSELMP